MKLVLENIYQVKNNEYLLRDVSFSMSEHEFLSVLSSKEESLKALAEIIVGLNLPKSGYLFLDGQDITSNDVYSRNVSVITMNPVLDLNKTIYDNIISPLRKKGIKEEEAEKECDQIIELFSFEKIKGVIVKRISDFQKLQVSLARSMIGKPKIILMIDPLKEIPKERKDEFLSLLKKTRKALDNPLVMYFGAINSFTTRLLVIDDEGRMIENGNPQVVSSYPMDKKTESILNVKAKELNLNHRFIELDCSFNQNTLSLMEQKIKMNDIFMMKVKDKEKAKKVIIDSFKLNIRDMGGSIPIKNVRLKRLNEKIVHLKNDYLSIVKCDNGEFKDNMTLYVSRDDIKIFDNEGNLLNSPIQYRQNRLPIKVLNCYKGLIRISSSILKTNLKLMPNQKELIIKNDVIESVSLDKKMGLKVKRIFRIEDHILYYLLLLKIDGVRDEIILKLDKNIDPLKIKELYIKISDDSFEIPNFSYK